MAENKGGSDLDVFEGLAKKSARPTTPGLAPPVAPPRGRTLLGGIGPVAPPSGPAPLPPPSLPKPPGSLGPLPPVALPPPSLPSPSKLGPPPPMALPPPNSAPPLPLPPPPQTSDSRPPAPLPPPVPPPGPSIGSQLGVKEKKKAGHAVDMDWDDEEESTHVYDKQTDGPPMPTQPRPAAGAPAASKVGAAASLLAASGAAAKPSMPPSVQHPLPSAPPLPPVPAVPPQTERSRLDEPTAIRPRPTVPQQSGSKVGVILGAVALVVVLALAAFVLIPRKGELNIDVKSKSGGPVAKAEIFVDGQKRCDTAPCVVKNLEPGTVSIKVLGEFTPAEQTGIVEAGKEKPVLVLVEGGKMAGGGGDAASSSGLSPSQAGLKIGGSQDGIKVFVDGAEKGSLPLEIKDLTPGTHKVRFEGGDRYEKLERSIEISGGETKDLGPIKLKVLKGQVELDLATAGANVSIFGDKTKKIEITDKQWKSPPVKIDLDPNDSYKVVATKKGFDDFKQELSFDDGQAMKKVHVEMTETGKAPSGGTGVSGSIPSGPGPATGPGPGPATTPSATPSAKPSASPDAGGGGGCTVNINSIPVSKVVLDGRPLGSTPKVGVSVPCGSHTVTFIHPDKGRKSVSVTATPGKAATAATKF